MSHVEQPDPPANDRLRRDARVARRALSAAARARADAAIVAALLDLDELDGAASLGWYRSTDGEVDLTDAVAPLVERGVRLHLPVLGEGRTMSFVAWQPGAPLAPNRYGIDEPVDGEAVPVTGLDAVIVPCVAVDDRGHRLGFGAGYYDRALADRSTRCIGVAFDVQVVEHIEPRPWDVPLDVVVTESRVLRARAPG